MWKYGIRANFQRHLQGWKGVRLRQPDGLARPFRDHAPIASDHKLDLFVAPENMIIIIHV